MEIPEQTEVERPSPRTSPGAMLRAARENLGLTRENVAEMLHLSTRQIDALEQDQFDKLPGATYVRGYIRGYCQLLNLDYRTVTDAYEGMTASWKTTTYSNLVTERQVTSRDNTVKLGTIAVAVFVFGLALLWWFGSDDGAVRPKTPAGQVNRTNDEVGVIVAPNEPSTAVPETSPPALTPAPATVTPAAPLAPKREPETPVAPSAAVPRATTQTTDAAPPVAVRAPATQSMGPSPAPERPTGTAAERARVLIRTRDTTWVDIRDGNGEKMLYETVAAGRRIALEGVTPFAVFLGNVDAVDVELNGAAIDVTQFRRGVTARFTLGQRAPANGD